MPIRAPRICSCGNRVAYGVQCVCQARRKAEADKRRPNAQRRGYDNEWQKARELFLVTHPRCMMCDARARVVDHRIPHRGDTKLFWDKSNWQSLCTHCHSSTKQSMERAS
jgi:5-methylcytosine-specific restriction endonuclease McrA